ncbi:salicylate hydroxylase [Xylaria bambusicola]|uniref:salicylate hydroxylase n=1 Tax=Xylaria bambusicola TaxID=326684 RepID=UPI0020089035|nr:salicylate hydroxylase [Xylaria bambusicola]KAI0518399.1 salicylate hydroxylase [Xylaria bambusicola]
MRIAIIGGGLAGVSLANLLIRNPNLEIEVYESKEFSERGATVGLSRSALTALERILPAAVDTLVEKAGAVPTESIRVMVGSGKNQGEFLFEIPNMKPRISVPRASLLKELLAHLPEKILHANMQLTSIDQGPAGVAITFSDGTTHHFDAVIGADGINSHVRGHILTAQDQSSPAGFWDCWGMFPSEKVRGSVDEEYLRPGQQYAFTADGAMLLYALVAGGTMVQAIISSAEDAGERQVDRKRKLEDQEKENLRRKWGVANGIVELLLSDASLHAYSQYEHKSTAAYCQNNICLIGDAAHASTPWQGAGAGQALEDCVILAALLNGITDPKNISKAFRVYESARMPRCKQVIQSSREVGNIMCSQEKYENIEDWRKALKWKWDFLYDFNLEEQEREALEAFKVSMAA